MKRDGANKSLWQNNMPDYFSQTHTFPQYVYDVMIVGGGITGISTGLLLQKAGKKCLIAEAKSIGFGTTGGTSAHLNTFMDSPYNQIQKNFNDDDAKLVCAGAKQALALVEKNIKEYNIDCEYSKCDGYLFSQDEKQSKELHSIYTASKQAGCDVIYGDYTPVPVEFEKAIVFKNQAQFHPSKYLFGIAKAFEEAGGTLMEGCRVTGVDEKEIVEIETERGMVKARSLIYATHIPPGVNMLHFRCAPYRSYVMALKLEDQKYPDGLAYDMYDPYHYYRTQEVAGEKYLIAGGEDHKTAHVKNTEECFQKLEAYLKKYFKIAEVAFKWSSQYYEPTDGLPYIGRLPGSLSNIYVATGYGGNGITYSHIAAKILTDLIATGGSIFEELFDPSRIKIVAGFMDFVKEGADVAGKLIGKWFPSSGIKELDEIANGEARVVEYEKKSIAIYKDDSGGIHAVNPACPHINCEVAWNSSEKSWDCPCHGSRFNIEGELLTGPARKDLEKIELGKTEAVTS